MRNKKYADIYIRDNYTRLERKFREHSSKINERGDSSLDKLNDTMLSLYEHDVTFRSYTQFFNWAEQKFGNRKTRKTRKCRRELRNTGN